MVPKIFDLIKEISSKFSLEEHLLQENETILGELLDPENHYPYTGSKGMYKYQDQNGNWFFVRMIYQPIGKHPFFELKTGWINKEGRPQYEPHIPPYSEKSSAIYLQKRSDTLGKIFRDEILPFFKSQDLSNTLVIWPISASRSRFSKIMINKFVSKEDFNVDLDNLIIRKK